MDVNFLEETLFNPPPRHFPRKIPSWHPIAGGCPTPPSVHRALCWVLALQRWATQMPALASRDVSFGDGAGGEDQEVHGAPGHPLRLRGRGCGPALPASRREPRFLALAYVLTGLSC